MSELDAIRAAALAFAERPGRTTLARLRAALEQLDSAARNAHHERLERRRALTLRREQMEEV